MTAVQSTTPSPKFRVLLRSVRQGWQRLIKPSGSIQDPGTRRQVQLLSSLLLVLIGLLALSVLATLPRQGFTASNGAAIAIIAGLLAAYLFSRTQRFLWGTIITVLIFSVAAFVSAVSTPARTNTSLFAYLPLAFLVAGFLLPVKIASIFVVTDSVLVFLLPVVVPGYSFQESGRDGGIILSLGVLILIFDLVRNLTERDRLAGLNKANDDLRALRDSLEEQVTERTAQLRASAEVGQAAASVLDPELLLQEVVNLITDRFDFSYAAVFTFDEAGYYAVLREGTGEAGRTLKERHHKLEVGGQSMVGYVTAQRKARIALDVGADPVHFANPLLPNTRSEIALPLIAGGHMLGALDVQSTRAAAFDEASAAVLQSMADQIAVALNNAEQFKQTERQAKLQASLNHLNHSLLAAESAADVYRVLATELDSILPHDYLSLTLTQSTGATLREYLLHADADPVLTEGSVCSPKNTLSGRAFTTRQPAVSRNLTQDANLDDAAQLAHLGFQSALSLPLIVGERVLGTLNFASLQAGAFSLERSAQFEQLAGQVAVALETQRLAQAQQNSLREMEALTRQLTSKAWAKRLSGQEERVQYARSGLRTERPTQLPEIETAIEQHALIAWSKKDDPDSPSPYEATLATPILLRGEVLGALQVGEANHPREWSQDDITFIQAVADQVALALDNARLIEETEQRAQRERLVAEVSSRMFAANDLETIVQIAGQELGRVLRVDRAEIKIDPNLATAPLSEVTQSGGNGHAADWQA